MKRSMVKDLSLKAGLLALSVLSLLPLAAQADRSSGNAIDPNSWVYGPRNDDTSGGRIWNPAKQKMIDGQHLVGRTVQGTFPATTDAFYCSQASQSNADFTWTEIRALGPDLGATPGACGHTDRRRRVRPAGRFRGRASPTPTSARSSMRSTAVRWCSWSRRSTPSRRPRKSCSGPAPFGRRGRGGTQTAQVLGPWLNGANYRQTFNNNLVLIVMIETIEGVKNAAAIAKVPGIHGVFAASGDLGNFSGWAQGDPEYERLINAVHDAAMMAGKRLCRTSRRRRGAARPDFTCFQN